MVMSALLFEIILTPGGILSHLFTGLILLIGYNFYFRTVRRLYYTFWGFSFILFCYLVTSIIGSLPINGELGRAITYLYLLSTLLLLIEGYLISSPIYFPRISWWEYDFRYRDELHVKLNSDGSSYIARLSDLRRGAGCLVSFETFQVGTLVNICAEKESGEICLNAQVMSRRIYSIGRGTIYGVRFIFDDDQQRKEFRHFRNYWRSKKSFRRKLKFEDNAVNS